MLWGCEQSTSQLFAWLGVQSVHALHCFCDVLENMFLCSLAPRYKSRNTTKRDRVGQLQNCTSYTTVKSTTCKASYIAFFVVKHDLLTINAYKLALTLQQKIKCTISQMCCTSWTKCTATTTTPSWGRRYYRKIHAKWSYLFSYWHIIHGVRTLTPTKCQGLDSASFYISKEAPLPCQRLVCCNLGVFTTLLRYVHAASDWGQGFLLLALLTNCKSWMGSIAQASI